VEIKSYNESYRDEWEQLCEQSDDAWFLHTREYCDYLISYHSESLLEDVSFFVLSRNEMVALIPAMVLQQAGGENKLFFADEYMLWPAYSNKLSLRENTNIEKIVFANYRELALKYKIKKIQLYGTVLASSYYNSKWPKSNLPLKYGYSGQDEHTYVIDTSLSIEKLWQCLRKGHRSAIKTSEKILTTKLWHGEITSNEFEEYRKLHALAAGRVTRPINTFSKMFEWINNKKAFLIGAKDENGWLGFVFFLTYKKSAYYASAANHPERVKDINILNKITVFYFF